MDTRKIKAAAQLLLAARNHEISLERLPDEHVPADVDEAYAIQDEVMQALGQIGGWKLTAGALGAQPACAPMPAQCIFAAPYQFFDLATAGTRGVEVELALRLKHDLPPRATAYTRHEVVAAIATVHPAIAMASSRYTESQAITPLAGLADALSHCALIYGPGRTDLGQIEQGMQHAELYFNGLELELAHDVDDDSEIWTRLTWLANHLATRCGGLEAGQFVTLAACASRQAVATVSSVQAGRAQRGTPVLAMAQA